MTSVDAFRWPRRALALVSCAGVVLFAVPGHLGLWRVYPFTQLSSMRMLTALGLLVGGLGCVAWALTRAHRRPFRPSTVTAAVALTCSLGVIGSLVAGGALGDGRAGDPDTPADLTVLSLNARDVPARLLADAVREARADVVMLVETPAAVVEGTVALLDEPSDWQVATNAATATSSFDSVGVLVHRRLGSYEPQPGPTLQLGSVAMVGAGPGPRHLAAVHPPPPVGRWAPSAVWSTQLRDTVRWCEERDDVLVGGDLNAVHDHVARSGLSRCTDATAELGIPAHGTWPSAFARPLGAGIDHQLADAASWRPVSAHVVDVPPSDHRGVVVRWASR